MLLGIGADPNSQDTKRGESPVHAAARYGHIAAMEFFLDWESNRLDLISGLDTTDIDTENNTSNNESSATNNTRNSQSSHTSDNNSSSASNISDPNVINNVVLFPAVDFSLEMDFGHDVLFWAAICDQIGIVEEFINRKKDITYLDSQNDNILSKVIRKSNKFNSVAEYILDHRLLPRSVLITKNYQNKTSLELAVAKKELHLIERLIEQSDDHSSTIDAFLLSIRNNDSVSIRVALELLEHGKEYISRHRGSNNETTMMWVTKMGNYKVLQRLCELCPELIETKDGKGETPVFYAARKGKKEHLKCVAFLIKKGCDIFIKNNSNESLIDICDKFNNSECKEFLLAKMDKHRKSADMENNNNDNNKNESNANETKQNQHESNKSMSNRTITENEINDIVAEVMMD